MKAFITGISGFVGAGLARRLLEEGVEVHGIIRPTSDLWRIDDIAPLLRLHTGDLLDQRFVEDTIMTVKPDVIFHLGVYGAYPTQKDKTTILSTSLLVTLHLLEVAKSAGVEVVVNSGSSSEYGTKDHPMREDERIDPNSYYAVGKAAQTLLCQQFTREEKLPVITLRLFSVYGPYEEPGRLVPTLIVNALSNKEISLADPRIARDFVYLGDVVDAYIAAAKKPELGGEVFNIGTGKQATLGELANAIITETESNSKVILGAYEKRGFDTFTWVADMEKTFSRLGFTPRHDLNEGLKESIPWFKQHADHYNK